MVTDGHSSLKCVRTQGQGHGDALGMGVRLTDPGHSLPDRAPVENVPFSLGACVVKFLTFDSAVVDSPGTSW